MTSTPENHAGDGADLAALREEIDELQETPTEQLVDPEPAALLENEPTPTPSDAIGSEKWDEPAQDEVTDL